MTNTKDGAREENLLSAIRASGKPCNNPIPGNACDYAGLMKELEAVAAKISDGHVSVLKFTNNWRVWFSTPYDRMDINIMPAGKTFEEAAASALKIAEALGTCQVKTEWELAQKRTEYKRMAGLLK